MGSSRPSKSPWRMVALLLAPLVGLVLLYGRAWLTHHQTRAQGRTTWAWNAANLGTDDTTLEEEVLTLQAETDQSWQRVRWHGVAVSLPLKSMKEMKRPDPNMVWIDLGASRVVLQFEDAEDYRELGATDVELLIAIGNAQYPHYFSSLSPDEVSRQYARYLVKGLFGEPPRRLFDNGTMKGVLSSTAATVAAEHGIFRLRTEGPLLRSMTATVLPHDAPTSAEQQLRETPNDPLACLEATAFVSDDVLARHCGSFLAAP